MRRSNSKPHHSKSPTCKVSFTPKSLKQKENNHPSLTKAHKLLASHAQLLLEQNMSAQTKIALCKGIKKLSHCLEKLERNQVSLERTNKQLKSENQDLKTELREERSKTSRFSQKLTWISTQTHQMKEKIEGSNNYCNAELIKDLQEKDSQISSLIKHNEDMKTHVRNLEQRIRNQEAMLSQMNPLTPSEQSPEEDSIDSDVFLQRQIQTLDHEIGLLQRSLKKALDK